MQRFKVCYSNHTYSILVLKYEIFMWTFFFFFLEKDVSFSVIGMPTKTQCEKKITSAFLDSQKRAIWILPDFLDNKLSWLS